MQHQFTKIEKKKPVIFQFWKNHNTALTSLFELQASIGHEFSDFSLLLEATTHRSAVSDFKAREADLDIEEIRWNERLEFLGDSVLSLVMSTLLWKMKPSLEEGRLSKIRSSLVNEATLASIGNKLNIGSCIALGFGEEKSGGRSRESLLADAVEAVFGAVYLDAGYEVVGEVIESVYKEILNSDFENINEDYKTQFQEVSQSEFRSTPVYQMLGQVGPDHKKEFEVGVLVEDEIVAKGVGASKKRASQVAAKNALKLFKNQRLEHLNRLDS